MPPDICLFVHVPAVANVQHPHNKKIPDDGIKNPKRPKTEPVKAFVSAHRLYVPIIRQTLDGSQKPLPLGLWLFLEELHGGLVNLYPVCHRDTPSDFAASSRLTGWSLSGSAS